MASQYCNFVQSRLASVPDDVTSTANEDTCLNRLPCPLSNPRLGFWPVFIEGEEPSLSSTLDQLVRLRHELRREDPLRQVRVGCDSTSLRVP